MKDIYRIANHGVMLLTFLMLLCSPLVANAVKLENRKIVDRLSNQRDWLGQRIDTTSHKLDLYFMERFFADEIFDSESHTQSRGKFFIKAGLRERKNLEGGIGLDVRFRLPNLEEHVDLVISSNDDSNDRISDTSRNTPTDESDSFITGLQFIPKFTSNWQSRLKLGVRWGGSPELFLEGRLRRRLGSKEHHIQPTFSAAHYTHRKTIYTAKLKYFKIFNDHWAFRFENRARYFNRGGYFEFDHTPEFQQRVNDRHAFVYQVSANGNNKRHPFIDSYTASIRWRYRLYHSWLFLELEPSHTYFVAPNVNQNPDSEAAFFVRLEMLINND